VASAGTSLGPPPPFDPECAAALALIPPIPPLTFESIPGLRQPPPGFGPPSEEQLSRSGAFTVEDILVPGPADAPDVALLVCRPSRNPGVWPAIFYIHGGGMIFGERRLGLLPVLDWALELSTVVVSVEYRLAPETPYPGPVEDCEAGFQWVREHSGELGIDPTQIVLAGSSAGGGLAASLALRLRDRGGWVPAGVLLFAPMLDDRNDSPSVIQMTGADTWDRSRNQVGWQALLGSARGGPAVSPYAAAARADDLSGLPPTYLDVGSAETFRDEVVDFASRIWRAGGQAELHVWPGGFHGYSDLVPTAAISRETPDARERWLRRLLATPAAAIATGPGTASVTGSATVSVDR